MALSQTNNLADIAGAVQKYLNAKWMNLQQREFDTPLANSNEAITGTVIPGSNGQAGQFRYFSDFTPTSESGNDSPKFYTPDEDVTVGKAHTASSVIVPVAHIRDAVQLSNFTVKTDLTPLMEKTNQLLMTLVRRYLHRVTNDSFVRGVTEPSGNSDGTPYAFGSLPVGFKNLYAGGASSFSELTETSVLSLNDFREARSILHNSGVPTFANGNYKACISHAVKEQLMTDDVNFRDIVKRHENMAKEAFVKGNLPSFEGFDWKFQHDEYNAELPSAGGALTTRANTGRVTVAHVYGMNSFGYIGVGGGNLARPNFKTQDITITGTTMTIGFGIPMRSAVIRQKFGLNVVGTTNFFRTIDDIA